MTKRLDQLPAEQQARIKQLVATAPPLTGRSRERLEVLFRDGAIKLDRAPTDTPPATSRTAPKASTHDGSPSRLPGTAHG